MANVNCPGCGASLTLRRSLTAGQKLRCPECQAQFLPAIEPEGPPESAPLARRRRRSTEGDEPDPPAGEDEERPRLRRCRPRRIKTSPTTGWLIGLILAGTLLLAGLAGIGAFLWLRGTGNGNREAAPAAARMPDRWAEITSAEGRFRIWMPAGTVQKRRTSPTLVGPVEDTAFLYQRERGTITYAIYFADFSPDQLRQATLEQVVDAWCADELQKSGGHLERERILELNEHWGREVLIRLSARVYVLLRHYVVGARLYTLGVSSVRADLDSPEVQAFFGSFRLTDGTP